MRVSLVFPPQWTAAQPYAAMAALCGEMRRAGHVVDFHDLNLAFYEYVLEPRTIGLSRRRLDSEIHGLTAEVKLRLMTEDLSEKLQRAGKKLEVLEDYVKGLNGTAERLMTEGPPAAGALRTSDAFYDAHTLVRSMVTLDEAFRLFSRPFWPAEVRWNDFSNPAIPYNFAPMLAFADETLHNPFRRFYEDHIEDILETDPDFVSISVGSFSQVLPGLTLARMVRTAVNARKAAGRSVPHIGVGGNFFSRLVEPLKGRPDFFQAFCDSLVIGEGEAPMVMVANALEHKGSLADIPNLMWLDAAGTPQWTGEGPGRRMADAALPDFTGFPIKDYLSPETVVCIAASKGCYYGECAFCDSHYGLVTDELQVEDLVERIRTLRDRHGIRHFEFIDQCIAPKYMDAMCDAFIRTNLDVRWFCNGRTEPGFTPELLRKMKQAGCTMVMWGVECASARLLKLMRKGVSTSQRMQILQDSSDAGLWNFAYIFFGFPTETEEEAMDTIRMIRDNTHVIHSYGRSIFTLGKHSPLWEEKEAFGILGYVEDDQEFSTNLTYRTASGLQAKDLNSIAQRCKEMCAEAYGGDPLWMLLRSRENLHLYLAKYGPDYVRSWRPNQRSSSAGPQPEFVF